jgi:hypothetical protein
LTDKKLFQFYKGKDYLALPRDPQPWLIERMVPSSGVMNLYGRPKLGKSFGSLGIASAISDPTCTQWLGHPVLKHGPITYLQVDTPRDEWAGRIANIEQHGYNIDNIYFTDANLVPYPLDITVEDIKQELREIIRVQRPLLLIVDTLREVHGEDENDSKAMRNVINGLVAITKDTNTALLLVSHSRKEYSNHKSGGDDDDGDLMDGNRGSGYTAGRMDVIAKLTAKHLIVKGRAIGMKKVGIDRDDAHMLVLDQAKSQKEANIKFVLSQPDMSERGRAEMLAAMEQIEPEAARSRLKYYRKHQKVAETFTVGGAEHAD